MFKKFSAGILCMSLLFSPMQAFSAPTAAVLAEEKPAIQKVINETNVAVINSYFANYIPLADKLFTSKALADDLNAKNEYVSLMQKKQKIKKIRTGYEISKIDIDNDNARIIINRYINIIINDKHSDGKNSEAYLLKKVNGTWKLENVFINWTGGPSNAYKAFEKSANYQSFTYKKLPLKSTTGADFKALVKPLKKDSKKPSATTPKKETQKDSKEKTPDIKVIINGKTLDFKDQRPVLDNNRILVPLRHISENLNAKVVWRASDKSITITNKKDTYVFFLNKDSYKKNGVFIPLDAPAKSSDTGRTLVPLRVIGEIFGEVTWSSKTKTASIKTNQTPPVLVPKPKPVETPKKMAGATSAPAETKLSAILLPLNEVVANNLKGVVQSLDSDYFENQATHKKLNLALKNYFEQTKGMTVSNFVMDYKIAKQKTHGDRIYLLIEYNNRADLKLNDGQVISSTLSPDKIGLVIKKNTIGLSIADFYSTSTDGTIQFNAFLKILEK